MYTTDESGKYLEIMVETLHLKNVKYRYYYDAKLFELTVNHFMLYVINCKHMVVIH